AQSATASPPTTTPIPSRSTPPKSSGSAYTPPAPPTRYTLHNAGHREDKPMSPGKRLTQRAIQESTIRDVAHQLEVMIDLYEDYVPLAKDADVEPHATILASAKASLERLRKAWHEVLEV